VWPIPDAKAKLDALAAGRDAGALGRVEALQARENVAVFQAREIPVGRGEPGKWAGLARVKLAGVEIQVAAHLGSAQAAAAAASGPTYPASAGR